MGKLAKESVNSAIFIALGFLIGTVANLFIYPYICTKEELGHFKLLLNWALIISPFIALGAGTIAVRFYPHFKAKNRIGDLNFVLLIFPVTGILIFLTIFLPFSDYFLQKTSGKLLISVGMATFTLVMFTIAQTFIKVYSGLSIALKRSSVNFMINEFLTRIILLICFLLFYMKLVDYTGLLVSLVIAFFIQLLIILISVRRFVFQNALTKPEKTTLNENLNYGLYSMLDSGANMIVTRLDILMIGILSLNANENAQEYDLAINIAAIIFLPWRSLISSTSPFIAEAFLHKDYEKINSIYKISSLNLFVTGGIFFILIICNCADLLSLVPGNYAIVEHSVLFLGIAKLIDMLASINNIILLGSPYYRLNFIFNLILIVVTIGTNYILIPIYGITGSAIATAITILSFNLMKGIFLYYRYGFSPFHQNIPIVIVSFSIIFTAGWFLPDLGEKAIVNMIIRTSVLMVLIYVFMIIVKPSNELESLRKKVLQRIGFSSKKNDSILDS